MKANYSLLALVCMGLSVPLLYHLANRDRGAVPSVRFATLNLALNRSEAGALVAELRGGKSEQARKLAELVQRVRPDVLFCNELDRDPDGEALAVFQREYLAVSQNGWEPIDYAFRYAGEVNTGVPSEVDVDRDGKVGGAGDAFGYGRFVGQYGMVLLSRYPILIDEVRTFQRLRWSEMPGALRPAGFWPEEVWQRLRLSSKSHWDVPIGIGKVGQGRVVHVLCSHPTPPAFDGPEDRNGRRNHDEIRFWVDYLSPGADEWIVDDQGRRGGLAADASFVVLGDLNCDPADGDARRGALLRLLAHPRVRDPQPRSEGGPEQQIKQFGANMRHQGDPALDTADFDDTVDRGPGNLRVDYVLPSKDLAVGPCGVFWPRSHEPTLKLAEASDHRMVWVDLTVSGRR